ncbi:sulfite exporter TauE/SafE family protein [Thioalkalivibrio sp. XN8]|uniref:sulfite exporter TauE/SafE family protein n=1 Tax=Thioalkalivibrio sp. XN8 TaxID=2712863 RepID=UPI001F103351|nr:sulfite exporter TauE/SafE family protein [Thioalkalivibrio sp. XN8]
MTLMETGLAAALLGGLVGSVHCLGMCGGIAGALGMAGGGRPAMAVSYSAGRIASYAMAGAIAGAIGAGLAGAMGLGPWLRLLMGAVLVLLGLQVAINLRVLAPLEAAGARLWQRLAPLARRFVPPRHAGQALALGALWGWLPCGLVYGMLAAAAGTGGAAEGALFMAVFGLGTAPAMIGVTWASGRSGTLLTARRRRLLGWLLVLFGAWTMVTPLQKLAGGGHGGHAMPATEQHQPGHHH